MKQLLLVFVGGGLGSALRYLLGSLMNSSSNNIPFGTFTANVLGSLLIGVILGVALKNNTLTSSQTLLLATGFCGGFTTFSAFAYENYEFLKSGDYYSFGMYTIGSFIVAIIAVLFGLYISKGI